MADDVDTLSAAYTAAYSDTWTEGNTTTEACHREGIRAVLVALPDLGYVHVGVADFEWAVRVDGGPLDGQVIQQGAEVIARDTVHRILTGTGVLLRRPIARGPWEEVPAR